jgi:hypothetical protein
MAAHGFLQCLSQPQSYICNPAGDSISALVTDSASADSAVSKFVMLSARDRRLYHSQDGLRDDPGVLAIGNQ